MRLNKNRTSNSLGLGNGGACICENCGYESPHKRGVPCTSIVCPECGGPMYRKESTQTNVKTTSTNNSARLAKIDSDLCVGCGRCISSCPFNAIKLENGIAVIDSSKCKGCMKCSVSCPVQAIHRA